MNTTLTATDRFCLAVSVMFLIVSVLCACSWYSKRQGVSYKAALLVLWQEGVVTGFKDFGRSFLPLIKAAAWTVWTYTKRWALVFWDYLKPSPVKHVFTPDLYYGLYEAVKEYIYAPFQPVIEARYTPYPSAVYVAFYTKSAITTEVAAEVVWHVQAAFQKYLTCYGLAVDYTAVPYVHDNYVEVWLYYAETPAEYPAYRACCHRAMLMTADPSFRPLMEKEVLQTDELVLGYDYEQWRSAGRVSPITWDTATAPHMMVSGPTGGGKTVFVKVLLEQLLRDGATVTVCDFKGYGDLRGFVQDYAEGKGCDGVLSAFCADFEKDRERGLKDGSRKILLFDEFGSFSASKEKKEYEALMRMMANVVYMGRAYGYHIIFVAQRFDAETIKTAMREQFGVKIYIGTSISKQSASMLFPNSELDKSTRLPPYCGYISTPKTDNAIIITPKIDVTALDRRLKVLGRRSG